MIPAWVFVSLLVGGLELLAYVKAARCRCLVWYLCEDVISDGCSMYATSDIFTTKRHHIREQIVKLQRWRILRGHKLLHIAGGFETLR